MKLIEKWMGNNTEKFGIGSDTSNVGEFLAPMLKVAVWNVHKEREAKFAYPECDIGVYQEAELMRTKAPLESIWTQSFVKNGKQAYGTLITSKKAIREHQGIVTEEKEPFVGVHKTSALAIIEWQNPMNPITLYIVSVHGLNKTKDESFRKQLRDIIDHWYWADDAPINVKKNGLFVLAGDFNTNSKEKTKIMHEEFSGRIPGFKLMHSAQYHGILGGKKQLDHIWALGVNNVKPEKFMKGFESRILRDKSDHPLITFVLDGR